MSVSRRTLVVGAGACAGCALAPEGAHRPQAGARASPPDETSPQVVMSGLAFGESPRWHNNSLWLCNWGTGEIIALSERGANVVLTAPTTIPYNIDWLPDGRMLIVSGQERLLLRRETDGRLVTHADLRDLSENPWNEIVVDGRGNVYVNGGGPPARPAQFGSGGTIVLITPNGALRQVAEGIDFPNGMVVTPDNRRLIVAESRGNRLTAFDIGDDGALSRGRIWANVGQDNPDGIALDAEGALWYADVPHRRCVRVREGGEVLQIVDVDRGCFACALGGADRRTLFILAAEWRGFDRMFEGARTGQVLTLRAPAPGVGWP